MMPYIQGDLNSLPKEYQSYNKILQNVFIERGKVGFLTIDESPVLKNKPHRAAHAKFERALHTEGGRVQEIYAWGGGSLWGGSPLTILEKDTQILLANNIDNTCAVWGTLGTKILLKMAISVMQRPNILMKKLRF